MKKRPQIQIQVMLDGKKPLEMRIFAKPCRNLATRYWVVLPGMGTRPERWQMAPTVNKALEVAVRRIIAEIEAQPRCALPAEDSDPETPRN